MFHKNVHVTGAGNINASDQGGPGITLTINGTDGGTGRLIMDAGAQINSNDIAGAGQPGGPITISATGGAALAAGSSINSENNIVAGAGGKISLTLGGNSTLDGTISSASTLAAGDDGGAIDIGVTGNLTMAAGQRHLLAEDRRRKLGRRDLDHGLRQHDAPERHPRRHDHERPPGRHQRHPGRQHHDQGRDRRRGHLHDGVRLDG